MSLHNQFGSEYTLPPRSAAAPHPDALEAPEPENEVSESLRGEAPAHSKPVRLSLACNQCRKRKVRCDAQHPKCRNCRARGEACETSDPRKPGSLAAVRRRATRSWQSKSRNELEESGPDAEPSALHLLSAVAGSAASPASLARNTARRPSWSQADGHVPAMQRANRRDSASLASSNTPASSLRSTHVNEPGHEYVSWLSRAYHESTAAQAQEAQPAGGEGESRPVETPDLVVNTDGTENKTKYLGGSSLQCLFNFADLHLANYGFSRAAPLFKHGMPNSEEMHIPLHPRLPTLPDRPQLLSYVKAFFSGFWPIYPVVDRAAFESDIEMVLGLQTAGAADWENNVMSIHIPSLAAVYAVLFIGMNETSGDFEAGQRFLTACYGLHAHLTAMPYLTSVQAILLIALALRVAPKDGQAWHMNGQAIRIAQSIGLHKSLTTRAPTHGFTLGHQPEGLRQRIWWSCYALEKVMQLECGRPSSIDSGYDHVTLDFVAEPTSPEGPPYFAAWVALTSIMGQISDRIYSHKFVGGSGEMLSETARLDRELAMWEASLPDTLKPRNTFTDHPDDNHRIIAGFLSQQYYHAQMSALRAAIIFPQQSFAAEVRKQVHETSYHPRLLGGASICAQAARTIVTQSLQQADRGLHTTLLVMPPIYLAAVVLALSILRHPSSRLARSDIELLASATEHVETWYNNRGFNRGFTQTCAHLRNRVISVFQKAGGSARRRTAAETPTSILPGPAEGGQPDTGSNYPVGPAVSSLGDENSWGGLQGMDPSNTTDQSTDLFSGLEFGDLWNMMDSDFMLYDNEHQFITP